MHTISQLMIFFLSSRRFRAFFSSSSKTNANSRLHVYVSRLLKHCFIEYMLHIPIWSTILAGFICSATTHSAQPCTFVDATTSNKTIGPINIITAKFARLCHVILHSIFHSVFFVVLCLIQFAFDSSFCFHLF